VGWRLVSVEIKREGIGNRRFLMVGVAGRLGCFWNS